MGHFQPTSASAGGSGFWLFSAWPAFPWARLKLKQRQLPIQRLILIFFMEATTVLDIITTVATLTTATTARDLLTLSLPLLLMPRLKLIPGMDIMDTDTVLDTMVDTMVDTMATPTTATMARGLLILRLPLLLTPRPTPTWCMEATTVLDIITTAATLTTATTARDLLMLSLPLLLMPRLIPGTDTTVDLHTTATHTTDMAMATATTGANKKGTSNPELASMKCQHFRRRPAQCSQLQRKIKMYKRKHPPSSNTLHLNIYTFQTLVYLHVYLLRPLEPQERTRNVWF